MKMISNITTNVTETRITINVTETPTATSFTSNTSDSIIVLYIMFGALALLGNSIVFYAYFKVRQLRTLTNKLVISSSVCGVIISLLYVPFYLVLDDLVRSFHLPIPISSLIASFSGFATLFNLAALTHERYVAIFNCLRYASIMTNQKVNIILAIVWGGPLLLSSAPLVFVFTVNDFNVLKQCFSIYQGLLAVLLCAIITLIFAVYIRISMLTAHHIKSERKQRKISISLNPKHAALYFDHKLLLENNTSKQTFMFKKKITSNSRKISINDKDQNRHLNDVPRTSRRRKDAVSPPFLRSCFLGEDKEIDSLINKTTNNLQVDTEEYQSPYLGTMKNSLSIFNDRIGRRSSSSLSRYDSRTSISRVSFDLTLHHSFNKTLTFPPFEQSSNTECSLDARINIDADSSMDDDEVVNSGSKPNDHTDEQITDAHILCRDKHLKTISPMVHQENTKLAIVNNEICHPPLPLTDLKTQDSNTGCYSPLAPVDSKTQASKAGCYLPSLSADAKPQYSNAGCYSSSPPADSMIQYSKEYYYLPLSLGDSKIQDCKAGCYSVLQPAHSKTQASKADHYSSSSLVSSMTQDRKANCQSPLPLADSNTQESKASCHSPSPPADSKTRDSKAACDSPFPSADSRTRKSKASCHSPLPLADSKTQERKASCHSILPLANSKTQSSKEDHYSTLPPAGSMTQDSKVNCQSRLLLADSKTQESKTSGHSPLPPADSKTQESKASRHSPLPPADLKTKDSKAGCHSPLPPVDSKTQESKASCHSSLPPADSKTEDSKVSCHSFLPSADSKTEDSKASCHSPLSPADSKTQDSIAGCYSLLAMADSQTQDNKDTIFEKQKTHDDSITSPYKNLDDQSNLKDDLQLDSKLSQTSSLGICLKSVKEKQRKKSSIKRPILLNRTSTLTNNTCNTHNCSVNNNSNSALSQTNDFSDDITNRHFPRQLSRTNNCKLSITENLNFEVQPTEENIITKNTCTEAVHTPSEVILPNLKFNYNTSKKSPRVSFLSQAKSILLEIRCTKVIAVIFIINAVCWLPLIYANFVLSVRKYELVTDKLITATEMLFLLNSCLMPYIYAICKKDFKKALGKIIGKLWTRRSNF